MTGTTREVVIAGAGNLAAQVFDCLADDSRWRPIGFIDDNKAGAELYGLPIYHPNEGRVPRGAAAFMAVGTPEQRRGFADGLAMLDLDWQTYIDRRSHVSASCRLGMGSLVMPFASIGPGATIGRFAYLGAYASVGGRSMIGDFTTLLPRASAGSCTIGADCVVGLNSACLDGAVLGDAVVLAPFTWVRKTIPARSFVASMPARVSIRHR